MCDDKDIKIAGNYPSREIKKSAVGNLAQVNPKSVHIGAELGMKIAENYVAAVLEQGPGAGKGSEDMLLQRQILLSFAAISGFEKFCPDGDCATAAKTAFFDSIKNNYPELHRGATDNGALSFYYLAFRRQNDVERRIGQTFAMLCSHDGDPVYQELGEALYCWFSSKVKRAEQEIEEQCLNA